MAKIIINPAKPYDATRIARLLSEWHRLASIEWPEIDDVALVQWVLNTIHHGYVGHAEREGRLLGVAGVSPGFVPWNPREMILRDQFFYVNEIGRKAGVPNALMDAIKVYAASRNMPLFMQIVSGWQTERLEKWYELKGGHYIGGTFAFGVPLKTETEKKAA